MELKRVISKLNIVLFTCFTPLLLALGNPQAGAETPTELELLPSGRSGVVNVPANNPAKLVTLWAVTPGNISQIGSLSISGPSGLIVSARAGLVEGRGRPTLASVKRWYDLSLLINGKERKSTRILGSASALSVAPTREQLSVASGCGGYSAETFEYLRGYLFSITGRTFTDAQICSYLQGGDQETPNPGSGPTGGSPTGPSGSGTNYLSSKVLIRKDTCGQRSKARYIVRIDLDLSRVSAEAKASGFSLSGSLLASDYSGDKAASIKPISDGKFAPQPLILMAALGFNERLNVIRWAKGHRITNITSKPIGAYASWRRHFLTRTPAGSLLRGGKATVELTNGNQAYSVCLTMVRRRQNVNGYGR